MQHAGEGHRNAALFHAAANLFEIVNTGYLNEEQVRGELTTAALGAGLGEREIRQTLDAQWRRKSGVRRDGWDPPPPHPVTIDPRIVTSHPALSGRGEVATPTEMT